MLQIVEVVPVATAAFLGGRRAWYLACWGSGNFLAAQNGQRVDEKMAYEMGRSKIMQALANGFVSAMRAANWAAILGALQHVHHNAHESASIAWRGVIRDFRLAWEHSHNFVMRKHRRSANVRDLEMNLARAAVLEPTDPHLATRVTSDQIVSAQASVAILVERGEKRTPDEIRELGDLRTIIKGWEDSHRAPQAFVSEPARQGFLGALASPGMVQAAAIAGAVILAQFGVIVIDQFRIGAVKHNAAQWKSDNSALRQDLTDRDDRLKTLRVQVTSQNVTCIQDQSRAATVRAKQEAAARVASLSARTRIKNASAPNHPSFDLSAALDGLRKPPAGPAPGAPAAGSGGSDHLEGGMLVPPAAPADAPASTIAPVASN